MINKNLIKRVVNNIKYISTILHCNIQIVLKGLLHMLLGLRTSGSTKRTFRKKVGPRKENSKNIIIRYSIAFPLILSMIDIDVEHSSLTKISFSVFVLTLISLLCFINVILYMAGYVLIQTKDYENKYPRFRRIINFYKNSSLFFMVIEGLICLGCLLVLLVFSLLYAYRYSLM